MTHMIQETSILVAYFSCTGTTRRVAEKVAKAAQAALFEIKPAQPYTAADLNWHDRASRSSVEMSDPTSRPALAGIPPHLDSYDTLFIGFPIWWYVAPTLINTFIEQINWTSKRLIPFATSGGSGIEHCEAQLHRQYPHAAWRSGRLLNGNPSAEQLAAWIAEVLKA